MNIKIQILFLTVLFFSTSCSNDEDLENYAPVVVSGNLSEQITADKMYKITNLTISGTISGEDWNILFEMATKGVLEVLDMTNARIIGQNDVAGRNDNEIPKGMFSYSKTLKEVYLPRSLKVVGEEAFEKCPKLSRVHLPEGLDSIAPRAFYNSGLTGELSLPSKMRVIARQAFAHTKITKVCINSDITAGKTIVKKVSETGEVSYYSSIYTIGGNSVFAYCDSLSEVVVNEGCTMLELGFQNCISLSKVVLPSTLKRIGCYSKSIEELLKASQPKDEMEWTEFYLLLYSASKGSNGNYVFKNCETLSEISLPENLHFIGESTFSGTSIKKIALPNNVIHISTFAFSDCASLSDVVLPFKLKHIGTACFKNCTSLNSIIIPDNVFYISGSAFEECSSLNNITFGENVLYIGGQAFYNCSSLQTVTLPSKLIYLAKSVFEGCRNLVKVSLPDYLEEIKSATFKDCVKLKDVYIGKSVNIIKSSAFYHCPNITLLNLPSSISRIEPYALAYTGLKKLILFGDNPPSVNKNIFEGVNLAKAELIVPLGSKEVYSQAQVWNEFGLIVEQ